MKLLHYRVGPVEVRPLIFIALAGHSAHIGQTFSLDWDYLGLSDARYDADLRYSYISQNSFHFDLKLSY